MGVTIYFEGKLKSQADFDKVMTLSRTFAIEHTIPYSAVDEIYKVLHRVRDGQAWDYEGPTKGLRLQPDENADPLWIEFDKDLYMQEYCKTQFAGATVHMKIIQLLRQISPFFEYLHIRDEGAYWESNNKQLLEQHFINFYTAAEEAKLENPKLKGPYRLDDGR